ncbi:GntR family transcriptional regulator [Chelativorans xinjiangense]|uniref:GntR family transcriptional regulator n=1 Tax=Chelativorans xinjiangense TaxID=2681485 RepID=UPI0013570A16|nr:GntR family transcriptional regulator [Chelativorans xinjiangense]
MSKTLSDRVFEMISAAILEGRYTAGQRLSEAELSAEFGVSRAPLREATRRLEERKLITRIPRRGVRVATLSLKTLIEIYTIREQLEVVAAREAAANITDDEIRHLRGLLTAHERAIADLDAEPYVQGVQNQDIHYFITKCTRNESLISILCDTYYNLIRLSRFQIQNIIPQERWPARRAFIEHSRIVDALADRDAELAELMTRRHIGSRREELIKALEAQKASEVAQAPRKRRRASKTD